MPETLSSLIFITVVFYFFHSLLASKKVKYYFGKLIPQEYYRLLYNFVAILTLVGIGYSFFTNKRQILFDLFFLEIIGYCSIAAGLVFLIIALKNYDLGEFAGTSQLSSGREKIVGKLNTSGMNRIVRHPLYFASLLIFWGLFFAFPYDVVLIFAVVSHLYLMIGTRLEEQKLIEDFGESYLEYQKSVPMLFPNVFKLKI